MNLKVVVVDNDKSNLLLIEEMAASSGLEVKGFLYPEIALDYIRSNDVDMVLTDFRMPKMDGLTLAKEIRKTHAGMPVIMITAEWDDPSLNRTAVESGVDGILSKPISYEEFKVKIMEAIQDTQNRAV
ncbi:MAG: hypothetical protein A2077_07260 [Nitrospirae bacterium GWC2_46_6]|nr:MAG: hypothetical protein A2077_07260 [Nitrospirae bacterium GWC2_46_6]OGW22276.1 MAG: hypothetical protein A2Z82_10135 [Nitrospirae bacterium GWA2_46_11]OGW23191.1 MAG: hypothetical protein A2X55_09470 [Nitrospirae bacterium GWB2_47_37]HAK87741.1 response regulator [Nitrospiraceae bacterium]HCZ11441.1 response regulator [Nitrospiraceae bacterium]